MITGNTASGTFYVFNNKEQSIPIVFVHGVGLTYEIWQPQLDFFKDYSNLSYEKLEKISAYSLPRQLAGCFRLAHKQTA